jgi:Uma2 family endonuclease
MSLTTRVSFQEYEEMIRRGEFEPREEHHVELIYGEVLPMSPIGPRHDSTVDDLAEWSFDNAPRESVRVRVQGSLGIPGLGSLPEPDLAWLRRQDYASRRPTPADVLLLIEVADSSLARDRGLKAQLYAEAGIADYWLVSLSDRCVEVRRDPEGKSYRHVEAFRAGQEVRPLAFPEVALAVDRLFPA